MAVAFATAPIVGQNFGAGKFTRVRATFRFASLADAAIMLVLSLCCQWQAPVLIRALSSSLAQRGGVARELLDAGPIAALEQLSRRDPGAAHAGDVR